MGQGGRTRPRQAPAAVLKSASPPASGATRTVSTLARRSRRSGSVMMIRAGLVLLLLAAAVPAGAHSWYTGLRNRSGISCCEDQDCRPVGLCVLPDKRQGLVIEGACRPIPRDK